MEGITLTQNNLLPWGGGTAATNCSKFSLAGTPVARKFIFAVISNFSTSVAPTETG